ncbi:hypothetical protein [Corynebacterium pygosceleis]|uniref:Uncharacterized protein n=1 Tax=Corynebacterium pygosceleis TaxID=2800406 RepID=A0A9Q4C922_9CORY|nr:hypothetical protein [Corynebacterium pygosceleis]MCK7637953.1 hypothetical protein [Corynebacterium pygosceleis]MCK7675668.1 hypothetical protein [Corynebacterium pygosceleis]MCX7468669.1 hypothetical protein [Corynebacterium pygosceleis]
MPVDEQFPSPCRRIEDDTGSSEGQVEISPATDEAGSVLGQDSMKFTVPPSCTWIRPSASVDVEM